MPPDGLLATWGLFAAFVVLLGYLVRSDHDVRMGWLALRDRLFMPSRVEWVGVLVGFAGLGLLALLDRPVYPLGAHEQGLSVVLSSSVLLGVVYLSGSLVLPFFAGIRRLRARLASAADGSDGVLPRSGPVVVSGTAKELEERTTHPLTGEPSLAYDVRWASHRDMPAGLDGGGRMAYGPPFVVECGHEAVVVDPSDAALALVGSGAEELRIESGDDVTVLGEIDSSGRGPPRITCEESPCYLTNRSREELQRALDRRWRYGGAIVAAMLTVPIVAGILAKTGLAF